MSSPTVFRPRPSIAIVGASTRSAAASAVRAGFQPLAADLFADADLRRIATATRISPYPDGFLDWLRAVEPPAWMYTGALENHPELVDEMAWIAPLWGNPGDVLGRVRSPWELADVLGNAGLLFPETRRSCDGLPRDGSWLAKTYQGASGSGVRTLSTEYGVQSMGDASVASAEHPTSAICFQRRIAGAACAAVYVASEGGAQLLGVTRQLIGEDWLGAHGFQYAGAIGPWPVNDAARATIEQIGHVLAEQFELIGLFGVDFVLEGGNVWTVEVNPRYTASVEVVERFSGVSALALHGKACGGESRDGELGAGEMAKLTHGKATLFAKREIMISNHFADRALGEAMATPWPTLADVPVAGALVEAGRPVLTIFADGADVEEAERQLRRRVEMIEQEIYSER
jgi:predicted ATP-grasp superfamily ATP-dependent carboligase